MSTRVSSIASSRGGLSRAGQWSRQMAMASSLLAAIGQPFGHRPVAQYGSCGPHAVPPGEAAPQSQSGDISTPVPWHSLHGRRPVRCSPLAPRRAIQGVR